MSRQLEVELTVTTERAEPEAPKPHTGRRGTQGVCVDKNLPAAHGYLRDLRSGATGTRLGSGCCTAASAGCSPRRATAVSCRRLLVRISTADSLFSWGAPSTYIHWFLCAPTCHAHRTPIYILPVPLVVGHEDSSCSGFRVPATRTRSVLSDGRASAQRRRRAQSDT